MKSSIEIDSNNEEQADEIIRKLKAPKRVSRISNPIWTWDSNDLDNMSMNAEIEIEIQKALCQDMSRYIDKEIMRMINGENY